MKVDDICSTLSHIPKDQIKKILSSSCFIWNSTGEYFHKDVFEVSDNELEQISEIISGFIDDDEYAIWTDVWKAICEKMPSFLENNPNLSSLGIRNALAQCYVGRYSFNASLISLPKANYQIWNVFQLFAKHHSTFTAEELNKLSKELGSIIYFDTIFESSVRVSHDLFVSKEHINFDIDAVDKVIASFMSKNYIRIREISSFLSFPNVEYEWNEYLLASFVYSYSKRFTLLNNGFALNNVAGVVVRKNGIIKEFVDACAAVLADAPVELKKKEALDYLADTNVITRRAYRHIDDALHKASRIRGSKG